MLISNALLFGLALSIILSVVMAISFLIAPDMWIGDYPPDIRAKYGAMSGTAKKARPLIAVLFFGPAILVPALAIGRLRALAPVELGFLEYYLSTFIVLMVFNLFDLLVVDWLVFVYLQPEGMVLPGTEGLPGYKDYGFHFRGFLIGTVFCLAGSLVISTAAWFAFS